jgi:hypothetical protein
VPGALFFFVYAANKWFFFILLAGWATAWFFVFKKFRQKLLFIISLLLVLAFTFGSIQLPAVQNFLVKKVTAVLSDNLKTKVSIKHVNFSLFNKMLIEGVLVEDRKKDTLLYAGTAKVNITDWFFVKDKATLQYLGLKNAVVNLKRTDSVWNYQFLADYFSSPKNPNAKPKKTIDIDFKSAELENIRFNQIDKWVGHDMTVAFNKLSIDADMIDFNKKNISINTINLDKPIFYLSDYTGNKPDSPQKTKQVTVPTQYKWNNEGWAIVIKNIALKNGSFQSEKETERLPYTDKFDGQHLLFAAINGHIKNVQFVKDSLFADVDLSTKEKCGFEIKKLGAKLKFTPDVMEFSNMNLVTGKSRLGNYYAMSYDNFNSDMSDFLHSVKLDGKFENSKLHSDDIAFFAPELKTWNRVLEIKGNAKGTIDNLVAKKMLIKSGNTTVDGDITLRGLPDIKTTFIDFKSNNLSTNYTDLVTLVPALKNITQPKLSKLGNINFKGNFTGFINDFVTYGNISTGLGNLIADVNMKLPDNKAATYSGKITSAGFKLGEFVGSNTLGNIALDGNVTGTGFTLKDLKANFKGNIHQLYFSGYNYTNITADGNFNNQIFTGHGNVNDPNLKIENFNGSVSLAGKEPVYNFDAFLRKANFKNLHFANEQFELTGRFNLNFTGNNIDNFLGTAKVNNATLLNNGTQLSFDSLYLNSFVKDNKKYLSVQSNELEANVTGNFKILELPNAFKVFLSRYYPAYIKKPSNRVSNQDFSFFIKTKNVDEYVQLLDKGLKGFNDATFSGSLNLAQNELNVTASVPLFEYDKKIFNDVNLQSKGNLDTLDTKVITGDIVLNDSLHFPGTNLSIKSSNDISAIALQTSASKTLSEASLNASVKTLSDGVNIHFSPSSFIVNDKKWQLEKDGELTIRKSYIDASEVKFIQGNQEIVFSTEPAQDGTDHTDVVAKLKKVNIDDFTPFFLTTPRLEGVLTGTITLKDPFGRQIIDYDAAAEDFRLDDKTIGNINLKGDVNITAGIIRANAEGDSKLNKFKVNGIINYKDTANNMLNIDFLADRFDISLLNNYLGSIFSNIQGDAVSNLKITGGAKNQTYTGSVTVTDGSLKVNYTQCKYKFNNETIIFNPNEIDFGTLQLKDTLNNPGTVSGKLYYNNLFQNMVFDNISFETGKMLLLNTTKKDNSLFYGKVIGNAAMVFNGDITDMKMKIKGEPSKLDSSHIYLQTGSSKEGSNIDYIDFIQFGTEMEDVKSKQGTNFAIDMDLTANPACKIDVILDEATGDIIKGQGNGKLNIKVSTNEDLSIRGRYDLTRGDYTFNFQTFLKKPFTLNKGTITWNGNPYLANLDIEAEYLAKNIDLGNISSSKSFKQRGDLKIIAGIAGVLNKPDIKFSFVLPDQNPLRGDYYAENKLEGFRKEPSEMNKQVASLLLLNTFVSGENVLTGSTPFNLAANTIGGVISGWLTGIFNKGLEKATNGVVSTYLDINSNFDLQSAAALLQANVRAGLQILLNNRLIILLGGNIDINNSYAFLANKSLISPDITLEYMLTKDGRWRAIAFNRSSIVAADLTGIQRNKSGVKISYRKDFDMLSKKERTLRREERKKEKKDEKLARTSKKEITKPG